MLRRFMAREWYAPWELEHVPPITFAQEKERPRPDSVPGRDPLQTRFRQIVEKELN